MAVRNYSLTAMGTNVPYGKHSVTCHPAEVTFMPVTQPIMAGTRQETQRKWVEVCTCGF